MGHRWGDRHFPVEAFRRSEICRRFGRRRRIHYNLHHHRAALRWIDAVVGRAPANMTEYGLYEHIQNGCHHAGDIRQAIAQLGQRQHSLADGDVRITDRGAISGNPASNKKSASRTR